MTDEDITGQQRIIYLITGYLTGRLTIDETAELETWIAEEPKNRQLFEQLTDETYRHAILSQWKPQAAENSLQNLKHKIARQKTRTLWPSLSGWQARIAAASILLAISAGGYFLLHKKQPAQQIAQNQFPDIKPGGNKAILTLSNGHAISLTDAKNGKVAAQGNTVVQKTRAGLIEYVTAKNNDPVAAEPIYNTLSTPRGGRFEGLLPDGTHVILDAASSIKYQVNVTGKERLVWITGQVHFKVAYDASRPFYVNVKGQVMKDLGTAFNINAYDDEPVIAVTLEEGSVSVAKGPQSVVLVPGEQAVTREADNKIKVQQVSIDDVIAWTKGQTSFQNEDVQEIMREVSRWYDVDIKYEGPISNRHFDGSISRNANLADLLKILEFDNIHFTVSGKTITVRP